MAEVPLTVLIVDDDAGFRRLAGRILAADGFTVLGESVDGESALQAVEALRPDLVLLDVGLPGINGVDVARTIASAPAPPAVVLVSSRQELDHGPAIHMCGACGFLTKDDLSGPFIRSLMESGT